MDGDDRQIVIAVCVSLLPIPIDLQPVDLDQDDHQKPPIGKDCARTQCSISERAVKKTAPAAA